MCWSKGAFVVSTLTIKIEADKQNKWKKFLWKEKKRLHDGGRKQGKKNPPWATETNR